MKRKWEGEETRTEKRKEEGERVEESGEERGEGREEKVRGKEGVVEAMSGTRAGGEVEGFMDISEDHEANGMFVEFPSGNQIDCTTKAVCLGFTVSCGTPRLPGKSWTLKHHPFHSSSGCF